MGLEFVNILITKTFELWDQAVGQILGPQSHFENLRQPSELLNKAS